MEVIVPEAYILKYYLIIVERYKDPLSREGEVKLMQLSAIKHLNREVVPYLRHFSI